jgi:DNA-binding LacI/PurR family transcriptional regulator
VNQPVTIEDVARAAGVSKATVSRVLNKPDLVAVATRKRIHRAIEDLGFRPNPHARGLGGIRRRVIGLLLIEDFGELGHNPFWALATNSVYAALTERDLDCQIVGVPKIQRHGAESNSPDKIAKTLRARNVDGYITVGNVSDAFRDGLSQSGIPSIIWGPAIGPESDVPTVDSNQTQGSAQAVRHLHKRGFSRLAHISGSKDLRPAEQRLAGFSDTCEHLKLLTKPEWILRGDGTFDSGLQLAHQLMTSSDPPNAIFCMNDEIAFGVLAYAERNEIKVPDNLAIAGFDNVASEMKILRRSLTSVSHSYKEIGESLADGIETLMSGQPFSSRLIDTHLFIGDTT